MADAFALEITLTVDAQGTEQTFYVSSRGFTSKPTDTPANTVFVPLLKNPGSLRRELFSGARVTGAVRQMFGSEIELSNLNGELDGWLNYGVSGSRVVLRYGSGAYPAGYTTVVIAYAIALVCDFSTVRIKLRDRLYLLDKPIVTSVFEGTGGLEGTGNTSKKKQIVFGQPGYIQLIQVDANKLIYFVQANAADVLALTGLRVPYYYAYDGGVQLTHGGYYTSGAQMLSTSPDPGEFKIWADSGDGTSGNYQSSVGPVYIRLGSPPEADIRFVPLGYLLNDQTETIRQWLAPDLCTRAGIEDAETNPATLPGSFVPSAGNRLIDGDQTYLDVLNDISAHRMSSFGFNRLDQWFTSELLDPSETGTNDASKFTFDRHNSKDFQREPVPGQEAPVWQVNVSAGVSWPCQTLNGADNTVKDILTRDPWQSRFTGTNDEVKMANPGAISAMVEIQGNEFPDEASKQSFIDRYIELYGSRRDLLKLTCLQFESTTLALELMDKVTVSLPATTGTPPMAARFGCGGSGRSFRIVTISHNLQARNITFGLWGGDIGPPTSILGGGSSSASSKGGTGRSSFAVGRMAMAQFALTARSTVTNATGSNGVGIFQMAPFVLTGRSTVSWSGGGNAVMLLHADDVYVDASPAAHSMTDHGGMSFSATGALAGKAFLFNGSSYIDTPNSSDFALTQGSVWSIDLQIYIPTATTLNSNNSIASVWKSGGLSWSFGFNSSGYLRWWTHDGSSGFFETISSVVIPRDTITHLAVWALGDSSIRASVNGVISGTTSDRVRSATSTKLTIGNEDSGATPLPSGVRIDEFRICITTIDYGTTDFTPPTGPY